MRPKMFAQTERSYKRAIECDHSITFGVFDFSKNGGRAPKAPRGGVERKCLLPHRGRPEECPLSRKFLIFLEFQNGAFWCILYTNSKVFCNQMQRKVLQHTVFLAIDADTNIKSRGFHQSRKLIPIQPVVKPPPQTSRQIGHCCRQAVMSRLICL